MTDMLGPTLDDEDWYECNHEMTSLATSAVRR